MQFRQALVAIFLIMANSLAKSQDLHSVAGEYYLEGVMETASGFRLNQDSSFDYFFSQGALDRYGKGSWTMRNDSLVFNSRPWPGSDFKRVKSYREISPYTKVQLIDGNTSLLSFFDVLLLKDGKVAEAAMNQQGLASVRLTGNNPLLMGTGYHYRKGSE